MHLPFLGYTFVGAMSWWIFVFFYQVKSSRAMTLSRRSRDTDLPVGRQARRSRSSRAVPSEECSSLFICNASEREGRKRSEYNDRCRIEKIVTVVFGQDFQNHRVCQMAYVCCKMIADDVKRVRDIRVTTLLEQRFRVQNFFLIRLRVQNRPWLSNMSSFGGYKHIAVYKDLLCAVEWKYNYSEKCLRPTKRKLNR